MHSCTSPASEAPPVSMFQAIELAVVELQHEAYRINHSGNRCRDTITCGELQKILDNAQYSARLLNKIRFYREVANENQR
jgi:hypothetical protein